MARPKRKPDEGKTLRLSISLTKTELEMLEDISLLNGESTSSALARLIRVSRTSFNDTQVSCVETIRKYREEIA